MEQSMNPYHPIDLVAPATGALGMIKGRLF
jgi:hypothetical protein